MSATKHPIQPLEVDGQDILRFKKNAIVCFLFERSSVNLSNIAAMPFSKEDREQFAQLIGDSLQHFIDQGFSREISEVAKIMYKTGESEQKSLTISLVEQLNVIKQKMGEAIDILEEAL